MSHRISATLVGLASLLSLAASPSFATNGYLSHGVSTAQKGTAGAGAALGGDILSLSTNPATLIQANNGWELSASLFTPSRDYGLTDNQGADSGNELFAIPQMAVSKRIDDNSRWAFSIIANGGMNTEYKGGAAIGGLPPTVGTFGAGTTGVDLAQVFMGLTYAKHFAAHNVSAGITGFMAYQTFSATGLANLANFSVAPTKVTNNGTDSASGFGLRAGVQYQPSPLISLGLSYQPKVEMGKFEDYAGLFAKQGSFDIPATWVVGAAFNIADGGQLMLDVQHIEYSAVASVGNPMSPLFTQCNPSDQNGCLGGAGGAGFGWNDMTVYKLGYQWSADHVNTWRVGYSKTEQPIDSSEVLFAILTPAVIEEHFTAGFGHKIDSNSHFDISVMYAPENSLSGANSLDQSQSQAITVKMSQFEVAASYSMGF